MTIMEHKKETIADYCLLLTKKAARIVVAALGS